MVQFGEEKMSKSLGNLITIKEALGRYSPDALRIFILNSHYRSPLTYSEETIEAAERGADRLRQVANSELDEPGEKYEHTFDADSYRTQFIEAMDDDFNTAQAIATLFDLTRDINRASSEGYSVAVAQKTLRELAEVMGLTLKSEEHLPLDAARLAEVRDSVYQELGLTPAGNETAEAEGIVDGLIGLRNEMRQAKKWPQADLIRARLDEAGINLEDTAKGTVWKQKR
jgi:cysteinyl-tRNA synthetase